MTKCVFVLGNGRSAKFISGLYSDGYMDDKGRGIGISKDILISRNQDDFLKLVNKHCDAIAQENKFTCDSSVKWSTFRHFDFIYVFFGGHVWVTSGSGRKWFNPFIPKKKWPKSLVPASIRRMGRIKGELTINCSDCGATKTVLVDQIIRKETAFVGDTILSFFKDLGFKKCRGQGYLCKRCQPK